MTAHTPSQTHAPTEALPERRTFFRWLTYGLSAVAATIVGLPFIGYIIEVRKVWLPFIGYITVAPEKRVKWVKLGPVNKFPVEETRLETFDNPLQQPWDGMTAHTGVYVRYEGKDEKQQDLFLVLAVNCAHLGCPVSWFPQSGLFMCPCHGGVYYANGQRAAGPPPHGLFECDWRVSDGQLEVQAPHYPTEQDPLTKKPAKAQRA